VARKKIVLVIVEGPSDASALERYFVKYFDSERIVTKIIHGDITTDRNIDQSRIKAHLGNKIKSWITNDKFRKSDIDRIIHIVDMDGAYIDDNLIQLDEAQKEPYYSLSGIKTSNVEGIRLRNTQKKENLCLLQRWRICPKVFLSSFWEHLICPKLKMCIFSFQLNRRTKFLLGILSSIFGKKEYRYLFLKWYKTK